MRYNIRLVTAHLLSLMQSNPPYAYTSARLHTHGVHAKWHTRLGLRRLCVNPAAVPYLALMSLDLACKASITDRVLLSWSLPSSLNVRLSSEAPLCLFILSLREFPSTAEDSWPMWVFSPPSLTLSYCVPSIVLLNWISGTECLKHCTVIEGKAKTFLHRDGRFFL